MRLACLALVLLAAGLAPAQIIPKDAAVPVEVVQPRGEFARRLNGAVMPRGKGWKAAVDAKKLLQIMLPERWKLIPPVDEDNVLHAVPAGQEKEPRAVLLVVLRQPADADPLDVDQAYALALPDALAADPQLKRARYTPTDSGYVIARGLRFALAGGTMVAGKGETYQQQQLVYLAEDRLVTIQFTARAAEFSRYADDVARIFASYQNLGVLKPAE